MHLSKLGTSTVLNQHHEKLISWWENVILMTGLLATSWQRTSQQHSMWPEFDFGDVSWHHLQGSDKNRIIMAVVFAPD